MATVIITSKDDNLFTRGVGLSIYDFPRNFYGRESTGGYIRAEMVSSENSDLFSPIHFSEIEIDGVVHSSVNDCLSALNAVIYNNSNQKKEFPFSFTPNLIDNAEDDYSISVLGVLESGNYALVSNIDSNGIHTYLQSWSDNQIVVNVYNNTGEVFNSQLNLILKEV